eukprot:scaffold201_cov405-Prasinococcus_capsulatus_cf.AAC.49
MEVMTAFRNYTGIFCRVLLQACRTAVVLLLDGEGKSICLGRVFRLLFRRLHLRHALCLTQLGRHIGPNPVSKDPWKLTRPPPAMSLGALARSPGARNVYTCCPLRRF